MTADLSALIARLEAAEEVTHALEVEFAAFLYANGATFEGVVNYDPELWSDRNTSPLLSLDAALALAERLGLDVWHIMYAALMNWKAHDPRGPASRIMPLALCIAILRAKQGEKP